MIRRLTVFATVVAAIAGAVAFVVAADDGSQGGYRVQIVFDDASSLIDREEIKVAGAIVGDVQRTGLTADRRQALITVNIKKPGIGPFHADAHCTIRPESLIGEKFVECSPGTNGAPVLSNGPDGLPLLPASNTRSPVEIDQVLDTFQLPIRQRLALLLNDLGAGFAARGDDLNEIIRRSNPVLEATDTVLQVLGDQNLELRELVVSTDEFVTPLAERRAAVGSLIDQANTVMGATASEAGNLGRAIAAAPPLLRQLQPTLVELREMSEELIEPMTDFRRAAPSITRILVETQPFVDAAIPATTTLGTAADAGTPALRAFQPIAKDLDNMSSDAESVSKNVAAALTSLDKTGGYEALLEAIFNGANTVNAFDADGHFARTRMLGSECIYYAGTSATAEQMEADGCEGHLPADSGSSSGAGAGKSAGPRDVAGQSGGAPKSGGKARVKAAQTAADPATDPAFEGKTELLDYLFSR